MIAYLDCSTGVSGDKFLGALLDVGTRDGTFTAEQLRGLVRSLAPEARVDVEPAMSRGVSGLKVTVTAENDPPHRTWTDVKRLLLGSELTDGTRRRALDVFTRLAEAEASVHGCAVEDVHFHEVGAIDSIVDVVGTCAGLDSLGIETLTASAVATGWGTVDTSHGALAVPAPATDALLTGVATVPGPARRDGLAPGELTTPTGAALVVGLASSFGAPPQMSRVASGYGCGSRDIGHPNVCRVTIGQPLDAPIHTPIAQGPVETVVLLETNIDHISPEAIGFAAEQLLAAGALDVWQTPVFGKKQRVSIVLSALVGPDSADAMTLEVHRLTGTLGVRRTAVDRSVAPRERFSFESPYGTVAVKAGAGLVRPEHDDVARVARETGRAYEDVRRELTRLAEQHMGPRKR